jgi:hypothetical protein
MMKHGTLLLKSHLCLSVNWDLSQRPWDGNKWGGRNKLTEDSYRGRDNRERRKAVRIKQTQEGTPTGRKQIKDGRVVCVQQQPLLDLARCCNTHKTNRAKTFFFYFIILYYDQQTHDYFTNCHTATCFDTIVSSSGSL